MAAGNGNKTRVEAFGAYFFTVEIDGEKIQYPFKSCSGLKWESAVVDLEEGGFNTTTRKLIGRTKFPNIVLKRGFVGATSELYKLRKRFADAMVVDLPGGANVGKKQRFNGVITQKGPNGTCAKWRFVAAWICKWEGPDFDASKNEISVETVEIAHEGLRMLDDTKENG